MRIADTVWDKFPVKKFRHNLMGWWEHNGRKFPWRKRRNPYSILVAEVLLHRTRADQVVPVYRDFLKRFPSVKVIASASQSEVKYTLRSLGLQWRSELLHKMALEIVRQYNCKIPDRREQLESLPGVSHYIASAVRCFSFGLPEVLLDTNTVRITGRIFDLPVTDGSRRSKRFRDLLQFLLNHNHAREFNFAMIDLGALICRPEHPVCYICPVRDTCHYAGREGNCA